MSRREDYSTIIKGLIKKIAERILRKTNQCDIFLMSSTHVTAFKTNDLPPMHYLMEKHKDKQLLWSNSFICNVTQQPTISIPICIADNELPVGIQIVGTVGCDDLVLQFAKTIEPLFPKLHSPLM